MLFTINVIPEQFTMNFDLKKYIIHFLSYFLQTPENLPVSKPLK